MSMKHHMEDTTEDRSLVIQRIIDAPAHVVFEACSNPELVKRWFGPKGWPLTMCEIDFRVGGRYRFAMTGPDGVQNSPFGGEYLVIEPNRQIVFSNAFEGNPSEPMIMTYRFDEADGKTTFSIHTLFHSIAQKEEYLGVGFEIGTNSALDNLVEVVAGMSEASA